VAVGSTLTVAALSSMAIRFGSVEIGVFLVDLACLVAFLFLSLRAERYWPLWVTALQIIGIAAHAGEAGGSRRDPQGLCHCSGILGLSDAAPDCAGTWRHQQRLARFGADRSWSSSSARSAPPPDPSV